MKPCIIALLLAVTSCGRYADPATYILPKNNKGPMVVIFSQRTGEPGAFRNGRRLYVIPANGVLKTRFDYQDGWRDDQFLVKNEKGYDTLSTGNPSGMFISYNTFLMFYPKILDTDQRHNLDSGFMYEILTVDKAHAGVDTMYGPAMDSLMDQGQHMVEEATNHRYNFK